MYLDFDYKSLGRINAALPFLHQNENLKKKAKHGETNMTLTCCATARFWCFLTDLW